MILALRLRAVRAVLTHSGRCLSVALRASWRGIAERLRPGAKREPVLAAWGYTVEGRRVLLHLMAGSKEDAETVTAFFEDMKMRGLNDPLLVTSDGAPGIIKAIEVCFPRAARQRCLAHRMRNLAAKVPEDVWPDFKARVQAAYH